MNPAPRCKPLMLAPILFFLLYASTTNLALGQIVGRWRSLETSAGGIGAMYEFHADGSVNYSPGAVVEMPWQIKNGELVLPSATVGGPEQKKTIKWLGDNKVQLIESGGGAVELTRRGAVSDAANPIVGEWIGTTEEYGRQMEMDWFFFPTGKGLLLLPFLTQQGQYKVINSTVEFVMPNSKPVDIAFQLKGDVLTLAKPEGNEESHFARY